MENPEVKWEKKVKIRRTGYFHALITSVTIAVLFGIFGLVVEVLTALTLEQRIIFWSILALAFSILMPLIIPTKKTHIVKMVGIKETIKEVDRPVEIIREVEKPHVIEKVEIVEKPVIRYREKKKKKLNIPRYDFLGSNDTMTYHKHGCRFSKLIKPKHKLSNNDEDFFIKAGFSPCKVCCAAENRVIKKATASKKVAKKTAAKKATKKTSKKKVAKKGRK